MHNIVAAVDTTIRSGPVLRWAAREAALTGDRLVAVTASGSEHTGAGWESTVRRPLDRCVETSLSPDEVEATRRRALPGRPLDVLLKTSVDAELLVLGTHRHRPPWRSHDLTARVLAQATCPVAVVADHVGHDAGRIAVGVDGSPASSAALRWARRRVERTGDVLIAVTAWHWVADYDEMPNGPGETDAEAAAVTVLNETLDRYSGIQAIRLIDQGHPADVLLDLSDFVDLVVVGNNGTGSLESRLLGSVSRRVAQRSRCPVVVVHENDEAGPE